jgi:polysaccharide pyruvyl transferase WcaK-like protein
MLDKIYVIGYYGYGSLGDDAMRIGLLKILETRDYKNIRCHLNGQGYLRNFLWSDIVVLGGGTHLRDWGKGWLKQSTRIGALGLLTRLCGKKFCMLNVGIDGEVLEIMADNISNVVTIRDEDSFDSSVVIDYFVKPKKKILGVSLAPVYKQYFDNNVNDERLATNLGKEIDRWLKINEGWKVRFFNFNHDDESINKYCSTLLDKAEFSYYINDVELVLSEISECSAFIGMRYHACQFAYKTQTPLMVINSYPSCRKFARFVGVASVDMEDILSNNFELNFKQADLSLNMAKSLAYKGVEL